MPKLHVAQPSSAAPCSVQTEHRRPSALPRSTDVLTPPFAGRLPRVARVPPAPSHDKKKIAIFLRKSGGDRHHFPPMHMVSEGEAPLPRISFCAAVLSKGCLLNRDSIRPDHSPLVPLLLGSCCGEREADPAAGAPLAHELQPAS